MDSTDTTTLWRPTGPKELALVEAADWRAWPPRLPDQPIFYPVLNEDYAVRIARDWNVPASGVGYVTRFEVESDFLARYPVRQAGRQAGGRPDDPGALGAGRGAGRVQHAHRRPDRGRPGVPPARA
ncbi:hypothetical protein GCM10009760_13760 [Kitasatospora kazusensis]|uniref:ADP-ribosylation/crystallin J1 n=1 Tax=Kitasatospora kazusensis TaxID=407974 RepID=A0ABN2Z1G2_9ACTN